MPGYFHRLMWQKIKFLSFILYMKIQSIKLNAPKFSSKWHIFCHDESSKKDRQYIREHLEEPLKDDEIRSSGRLDEYELSQLIKSLVLAKPVLKKEHQENSEINYELLESAGLSNFEPLYGNNSFRAGLNNLTKKQLETIKQAGIEHIVDLRKWGEPIKCDGIEVFKFPVYDIGQNIVVKMSEDEFIEEELEFDREMREQTSEEIDNSKEVLRDIYRQNKEKLCNRLVQFIQTMQKENVLIGCEFGTHSTDHAIELNYFFNPKANIMLSCRDKNYGFTMQRIYEGLSQEDKEAMGWDSEFDKNFLKKLERYGYWID